jgi:hypothetical protein
MAAGTDEEEKADETKKRVYSSGRDENEKSSDAYG